ncbi:MarR family transcriptional regulator [Paraburkholderia sp. C35]|uniref:MarR family winged helix-turn-helix transcriptional regulator n=1 Tax=Paraburkholderia sp. C35 TaxID=2126993 RepID=UPI000D692547|nr:MarR family transcriptional regulator [Paraburkholderia sp. C35]
MTTKTAAKHSRGSQCGCTALRKATRRISHLFDVALAPTGLKITQRAILAEIGRQEPTNVGRLAASLVMDSGALAHTLKPLERDGLVSLDINPTDRRHRLINLTERGREKLSESDVLWTQAQSVFDAALGNAEAQTLRALLDSLTSDEFAVRFSQGMARPAKAK